ncbi:unnamed protein product [Choristocarpus tenellus]
MDGEQWMREVLQRRRDAGTLRELRTPENDGFLVDFTSNDYLGLGRSERLHQAVLREEEYARQEASRSIRQKSTGTHLSRLLETDRLENIGNLSIPIVGSGGSRLLSGNSSYAEKLEDWIAKFHNREASLLFNSGYDANLGLLSCVPQSGDVVVCDELVHNSVQMGCRLGRQSHTLFFRHQDTGCLETILKGLRESGGQPTEDSVGRVLERVNLSPVENIFIVVESVYSMDGDIGPLRDIFAVAQTYEASIIVDEAHSTGVFGDEGRGIVNALGLEKHPSLLATVHTFGKAFGAHGAVVVGSSTLRDFLVNYARPLIYSTSLPLHSLACIKCSYIMQAGANRQRAHVLNLVHVFQRALTSSDTSLADQNEGAVPPPFAPDALSNCRSPIQSVMVPGNERVLAVSSGLRGLGFDVRAIRKPTVPAGTERLRVTLHAHNSQAEVLSLAHHIRCLTATELNTDYKCDRKSDTTSEKMGTKPKLPPAHMQSFNESGEVLGDQRAQSVPTPSKL